MSAKPPVILGPGGPTPKGSSNTSQIMRCMKLYQYAQVRKLRVPSAQTPAHFAVGSLFAAMRARWFSLKFASTAKAWRSIVQAAQEEAELAGLPIDPKDEQYAVWLMQCYMDHWLKQARPTPIAAEYPLAADLGGVSEHLLDRTGKLDDLSRYPEAGGALCIGEAKTTSGDIGSVVREYENHPQTLQYQLLYKLDPKGEGKYGRVAGTMLDVVRKEKPPAKPGFARVFVEIRPDIIERFRLDAAYYVGIASAMGWDTPAPRSYQCTYMHGRAKVNCTYKDLCRFGAAAAGGFVLEGGASLTKHKPKEGARAMPWE